MSKQIIIIGGGISGLALLHYLKQKYIHREDVQILLLEKNGYLGGTIRSIARGGCLFETGPNGFLDSRPRTLEFVKELGLESRLVRANEESRIRHLSVGGMLHPLPSGPKSFLSFEPLNLSEKFRVLGEIFIPKGGDPDESVYDFGKRRLGEKFAKIFLDPMVSGIYGGDAQKTNLKAVFPRIYALEEEYGSLFKAMIKIRKARKAQGNGGQTKDTGMGGPGGTLTSFQKGVTQIIEAIGERYKKNIHLNQEVESISCRMGQYATVSADGRQYTADELFICTPAYSAGPMIKDVSQRLSEELAKINYAPIAVVGLVFPLNSFSEKPKGYGYLIPSSEKKEVLGVLFESNIFPGRCRNDQIMFRVMIGGARHPDILKKTKEELVNLALEEVGSLARKASGKDAAEQRKGCLQELFFVPWAKAIPQYDLAYCETLKNIEDLLQQSPKLHLVANYLKGVSLNDCIESAYQGAQKSCVARK